MRKRLVAFCLPIAALTIMLPTQAFAKPRVIHTHGSNVSWMGGWHVSASHTYGSALRALKRPSSQSAAAGGLGCNASWPQLGVALSAWYYGCQSRSPITTIVIRGSAGRSAWQTDRGLRIGDPIRRIRQLHRGARSTNRGYLIAPIFTTANDCYCFVSAVVARTNGGIVSSFMLSFDAGD